MHRILITGATGNLGTKLVRHWQDQHELRLVDIDARGDANVRVADLSRWDLAWVEWFREVDKVVHLAGNPVAFSPWQELIAPNVDALVNVFLACREANVERIIFASSNHVMGGYQHRPEVSAITRDLPPLPGTEYVVEGRPRRSDAYGAAKLFGERLGKCWSEAYGISVIAVRLGWVFRGENRPQDLPSERGDWFRRMWLSNRDFLHLMDCCLAAPRELRFAVVHGMSRNRGMRWDIEQTRELIGYEPQDDVESEPSP